MDLLMRGTTFPVEEILTRLLLATLLGLLLGLDREVRGKQAGLRTHAIVALSSAAITIASLDLYGDVRNHGGSADPLRGIQGLAQAIGFIVAGMIFVARGNVRNLTTAANVWISSAVGIAAGAGQFALAALTTGLSVLLLLLGLLFDRISGQNGAKDD